MLVEMRGGEEMEIAGLKEAQIQSSQFLVVIYTDKQNPRNKVVYSARKVQLKMLLEDWVLDNTRQSSGNNSSLILIVNFPIC